MNTVTYRLCRYIPNLLQQSSRDDYVDFAVIVAAEKCLFVIAADLADLKYDSLDSDGPLEVLMRRIRVVLNKGPRTGFDALEQLGNSAPSNLLFHVQETIPARSNQTDQEAAEDAGMQLFRRLIDPHLPPAVSHDGWKQRRSAEILVSSSR